MFSSQNVSSQFLLASESSLLPKLKSISLLRNFAETTSGGPVSSLSLPLFGKSLILSLIPILLAWNIVNYYQTRKDPYLSRVPGPWFASWSILYRFYYAVIRGDWHHHSIALHHKYGNVVRITPTEVSVWDPEAISEIYAYGDKGYPKCDMYDIALPNGYFNLAVERDIARHAVGRRVIAKDYTMMATLKNESYFDAVVKEFVTALDKNFSSIGKICNFTIWSEFFAYDMITDLVFGKSFGFSRTASDVGGGIRDLRQMLNLSPFLSYMPWVWPLTKNEQLKKAGNGHYSTSTRREIASRQTHGNPSGRHDFLQGLMEARYPSGEGLPLGEITNHAYIFILAAPDTVSVALRKILFNLVQHPKIHAELLSQLLAAPSASWSDLSTHAPLLLAVIKESLRLHPPAGFSLPRAVPAGGRTVCGYFLPENTTVGISAWACHYNTNFWGPDATEFNPYRWLGAAEDVQKLERYTLTFGAGARACLGKHVALIQLAKVVAGVTMNFDWEIVEPEKIKEVFLLLVVVDGMKVAFKRREGGPLDETVETVHA
ncbi:cytochrome P450 [Geopyxis carbonaria]|nr:cytochrome P450 [Geopyxis carbonaria]